ncbi:uncharacterized protein [Panulirus ornatus]|uniref:uncharacterized protein n=1 Tax=Panulirus ornatus TaxID=150431 RepID=UPI003A86027D
MVDWETGNSELHAGRMHAVAKDSVSFPVTEMLQEDETELNVMDFVETEYKSDKSEDVGITRNLSDRQRNYTHKKVINRRKDFLGDLNDIYDPRIGSNKVTNKRKKQKFAWKPTLALEPSNNSDDALHYPYATCLKKLCDEVGNVESPVLDSFPTRLFDQLRHDDVHYPYASLLEELHQNAEAEATNIPSTLEESYQQDSSDLGIADVMRNLHYPTKIGEDSHYKEDSQIESFDAPFSTMLLAVVMQQKMQDYTSNQSRKTVNSVIDCQGIGEILKTCMPQSQDDPPPGELHSSALLQKLSLSAQQNQMVEVISSTLDSSDVEYILESSTSESSHIEEDDLEWKPTNWLAKKVSSSVNIPKKRKSRRKKKHAVNVNSSCLNVPGSSQNCLTTTVQRHSGPTGYFENEFHTSSSPIPPSRLLQLIMGNEHNDSGDSLSEESLGVLQVKKSRKSRRRSSKLSKKKGKRKNNLNSIQKDTLTCLKKLQSTENSSHIERAQKEGGEMSRATSEAQENYSLGDIHCTATGNEPMSLLKEYLLKPAGEEITPGENCDIPKVETNFLFSRLLQNFKNLAESSQMEKNPVRGKEGRPGPSILRGMLVGGKDSTELPGKCHTEETQDKKSFIEHMNIPTVKQCSSQASVFDGSGSVCKAECEQDIKLECDEDVLCKIECEEDTFECQVCHLQFSSGVDLSNHQILFHCNEDPQTSSPHKLLPCSVDNLQNSVMQEKLPA